MKQRPNKRKTIQSIYESKSCFLEKINQIDKPLANITLKRRGKTHISKFRD
jgi:hypothetical protein